MNSSLLKILKRKRVPTSLLGLSLEATRLDGVVIRRSNGSLQVRQSIHATLALNPLTADPELVGREIRNHLEQAGVVERRCQVCLPVNWALSLHLDLPPMPEEEVANYIQMEVERGLPYAPEALVVATSRARAPGGKQFATVIAVPKDHLRRLDEALKAAKLRPLGYTVGIAALIRPESELLDGMLTLLLGPTGADVMATAGGGIVAVRSLEGVFEAEGTPPQLSVGHLVREIKITLGQLPVELRALIRTVRVIGRSDGVRRAESEIRMRLAALGMNVDWVEAYTAQEFNKSIPSGTEVSPAFSAGAKAVTGIPTPLGLILPQVRPWQRITSRFSSKKLGWAVATAAALVLLVGGGFFMQQWKLNQLRGEWFAMEPRVRELEGMQQQIRRFRPWFDQSLRNLTLLRKITEAFPEDGAVSAKTLEIRDLSSVTCSGTARDNQALLSMLEQLRASREVSQLKVDSIRGKAPLQFTFNFHWGEGGPDGN